MPALTLLVHFWCLPPLLTVTLYLPLSHVYSFQILTDHAGALEAAEDAVEEAGVAVGESHCGKCEIHLARRLGMNCSQAVVAAASGYWLENVVEHCLSVVGEHRHEVELVWSVVNGGLQLVEEHRLGFEKKQEPGTYHLCEDLFSTHSKALV